VPRSKIVSTACKHGFFSVTAKSFAGAGANHQERGREYLWYRDCVSRRQRSEVLTMLHPFLRGVPSRPTVAGSASMYPPTREWAQVVVCAVDGDPIPVVLPAPLVVNVERLLDLTGAHELRLAQEHEPRPPEGALVYADVRLALARELVFATGTSSESVAMRWVDFVRSVRPIVGDFAEPARGRVGAYRLSPRE
jgi:hypothetical protein